MTEEQKEELMEALDNANCDVTYSGNYEAFINIEEKEEEEEG